MHVPVLKKEVLQYLDPKPNENFIDCTLGEGGHSLAILEKISPKGKVLGIEQDCKILKNTRYKIQDTEYKDRLIFVPENFANLKEIVKKYNFEEIKGILFDLGISSWHLEESKRGFSFQKEEPLDMRHDSETQTLQAKDILNNWPESEIENILKKVEEGFAKRISKRVVDIRSKKPITTTFQLIEIIRNSVPKRYCHQRLHFATKTFLALRITVNKELENLEKGLVGTLEILKPGGRIVVISFHSLEDRIVKNFFRENNLHFKTLTKKPIRPTEAEIKLNPRSRSAKLRAAVKTESI